MKLQQTHKHVAYAVKHKCTSWMAITPDKCPTICKQACYDQGVRAVKVLPSQVNMYACKPMLPRICVHPSMLRRSP